MNSRFYTKLAITNIKNHRKAYIPYMITCIFSVAMFYILYSIRINPDVLELSGGSSLVSIMTAGSYVIAIFITIFLFYTNSFLIKQRKKELGLYNVLGLDKGNLKKMLFIESFLILTLSFLTGIIFGVLLDKLMFALLFKLLSFPIPLGFRLSLQSIAVTFILIILVFILTYIYNIFHLTISKPIELLKGGQYGEREPKTKWLIAIIGFAALISGYFIALSVDTAIEALAKFFPAVILVMIGTYGIFSSASILILKLLRKNKNFYYKTENFITVSNMMYRMKQNAVGLANICILSTAVLVMISTTASLYFGSEDVMRTRYPRQVVIKGNDVNKDDINTIDAILDQELQNYELEAVNSLNFRFAGIMFQKNDKDYSLMNSGQFTLTNSIYFQVISLEDYNQGEGSNYELKDDEVIIITPKKEYQEDTLTIGQHNFQVTHKSTQFLGEPLEHDISDTGIIITNNIKAFTSSIGAEYSLSFSRAFDLNTSDENIIDFSNTVSQKFKEKQPEEWTYIIENAPANKESFFSLYGGLYFLGIFIGALFLMATVLIIYYKQISEGFDDKQRFHIMQEVGLDKSQIKRSIRKQILIVFFLPLVFAVIHIGFAFPIMVKMLQALNLYNIDLFMLTTTITIIIFALIYALVFTITAKAYYNIVEA